MKIDQSQPTTPGGKLPGFLRSLLQDQVGFQPFTHLSNDRLRRGGKKPVYNCGHAKTRHRIPSSPADQAQRPRATARGVETYIEVGVAQGASVVRSNQTPVTGAKSSPLPEKSGRESIGRSDKAQHRITTLKITGRVRSFVRNPPFLNP